MFKGVASAEAQEDNGFGHQAHTDGAGEADNRGNLKTNAGFTGYKFHILPCQTGSDSRHQVSGHSHSQRGWDVNQRKNDAGQETVTGLSSFVNSA